MGCGISVTSPEEAAEFLVNRDKEVSVIREVLSGKSHNCIALPGSFVYSDFADKV